MSYNSLSDVGHRLLVEPSGISLSRQEKDLLSELKPQSFMFRARNFDFRAPYSEWREKFALLLKEIREAVGQSKLLLSIDHEGGRVVRPPKPITRFPYAARWGSKTRDVTKAMAIELSSIGMNVSWAPVADVLTNPNSKAIGQRAFSDQTSVVIEQVCLMAQTLEENGIIPGAKHFPGYGAVTEDAHFDLPVSPIPKTEWDDIHLPPFRALIQQRIRFIMTAHIMCPELDKNDQATLSKPILVDLLREQMGFNGVVVADALGMGAIRDQLDAQTTIDKALRAELDLFCIAGDSVDLTTAKSLAERILAAVNTGRVDSTLLDRSRSRIVHAINLLPQPEPKALSELTYRAHKALADELDPTAEWANFQYIPQGF